MDSTMKINNVCRPNRHLVKYTLLQGDKNPRMWECDPPMSSLAKYKTKKYPDELL